MDWDFQNSLSLNEIDYDTLSLTFNDPNSFSQPLETFESHETIDNESFSSFGNEKCPKISVITNLIIQSFKNSSILTREEIGEKTGLKRRRISTALTILKGIGLILDEGKAKESRFRNLVFNWSLWKAMPYIKEFHLRYIELKYYRILLDELYLRLMKFLEVYDGLYPLYLDLNGINIKPDQSEILAPNVSNVYNLIILLNALSSFGCIEDGNYQACDNQLFLRPFDKMADAMIDLMSQLRGETVKVAGTSVTNTVLSNDSNAEIQFFDLDRTRTFVPIDDRMFDKKRTPIP
eukprot:TRINITY_DN519_c0_g1_i1.p1 TRINITY_DN519_c0_g1~~TRINITY_DN519_c0_g1_i1.p1  ORF type:complete len:292 (+),score=83.28 TRINITY_DN519_c0_g1_i1:220-1095(+)